MRPGQQNKRMRGNRPSNNRRGPNPLTRTYEWNGPDVKIRGNAHHVAEKYLQLTRNSHTSGDPVAAENYLQHAEHYFRSSPPPRPPRRTPKAAGRPGEGEAVAIEDDEDSAASPTASLRPLNAIPLRSRRSPMCRASRRRPAPARSRPSPKASVSLSRAATSAIFTSSGKTDRPARSNRTAGRARIGPWRSPGPRRVPRGPPAIFKPACAPPPRPRSQCAARQSASRPRRQRRASALVHHCRAARARPDGRRGRRRR